MNVGDTLEIGVYVVSDSEENQFLSAAQIIFAWDPAFLHLTGLTQDGATPLMSSSFPADVHGLNESSPPQDGDGFYVAFANFLDPIPATPEGTLLTTFLFEALAPTPSTTIQIVPMAGMPAARTIIFDAFLPNTNVTGTLHDATVAIVGEPPEPAVLSLEWDGGGPLMPGEMVTVRLAMSNLKGREAAGFQAFLEFDTAALSFVSGAYTPEPFGLPLIPIAAAGGSIDLAAGIDMMQAPSSADAILAELTFTLLTIECEPEVLFRLHDPATQLTDAMGEPILPLTLVGIGPSCDCNFNCDAFLNSQDFFDFVTAFFTQEPRADYNADGFINSQDFFDFLTCFFTAPPECAG